MLSTCILRKPDELLNVNTSLPLRLNVNPSIPVGDGTQRGYRGYVAILDQGDCSIIPWPHKLTRAITLRQQLAQIEFNSHILSKLRELCLIPIEATSSRLNRIGQSAVT